MKNETPETPETQVLDDKQQQILELLQKTQEQLDKVIKAAEEFIGCK